MEGQDCYSSKLSSTYLALDTVPELLFGPLHQVSGAVFSNLECCGDLRSTRVVRESHLQSKFGPITERLHARP